MFYQDKIEYGGDPVKAIQPGGWFIWTLIADNVPVTHLAVADFWGRFMVDVESVAWRDTGARSQVKFRFDFNDLNEQCFIGEKIILYELFYAMFCNSKDAGATVFRIDVRTTKERVVFVISDDGSGIRSDNEHLVLREPFTTRSKPSGYTLYLAGANIKKIGGKIAYTGEGLDGRGASFEVSFLKDMPTAS